MPKFSVLPCLLALALFCVGSAGLLTTVSAQENAANLDPMFAMSPAELPAADKIFDWQLPPLPEPISDDEAEKLLGQLSDVRAGERQQARRQLREHGLRAGPALLKAVRDADPELALAARALLRGITEDNTPRRLHQMLVEEVQFGKANNQLSGLVKTLSTTQANDFARLVFAMRHQLEPGRINSLLASTRGPEARRLKTWVQLLANQHGAPMYAMSYSRSRPKLELLPEHEAYLERAASSNNPALREHIRKWAVAGKLDIAQRSIPLREESIPVRNALVFRFSIEQPKFLLLQSRQILGEKDQDADTTLFGLDMLSAGKFSLGKWTSYKPTGKEDEDFAFAAAYLDHEDPRVRLRAAFALIPPKLGYKHEGSSRSSSLDTELFTRHRADDLLAVADWMDKFAALPTADKAEVKAEEKEDAKKDAGKTPVEDPAKDARPVFPRMAIDPVSGESWFTALHKVSPAHMPSALRVLAKDLVSKEGPEHAAILSEIAGSLLAFRLASTPMKYWPTAEHQVLLEASIYSSARDPLIYTTQDQFNGQAPAFLLPVFKHGPVPADRGYAMIAAATCAGQPEAIAVFKAALEHPSVNHRVEAAMALAFLGEEAGRDAARSILDDDNVSETLRSKAAVALAAMRDKKSYAAITKRFEALLPQELPSSSTTAKARSRYLYSLRDARPEVAEDFVVKRLRSSRCPQCMRNSSRYCTFCSRDGTAVAALAYLWNLTGELPEENKTKSSTPHTLWEFIRFLKTAEPKTLDFQTFSPLLRVPAGKSLDLRVEAATKIDQVTGGKTDFADLAKAEPDRLEEAYKLWRNSKAALPFLDKDARITLELQLQLAPENPVIKADPSGLPR